MFLFQSCINAANVFASSLETEALLEGTSDAIVVKQKHGGYQSTPFLACFGPYAVLSKQKRVKLYINGKLINDVNFLLDCHGYSTPLYPSDKQIQKMNLRHGKNEIIYELDKTHRLTSQVHLFTENDKILISDLDGTLTKNDIGGLIHNFLGMNYLHDGYAELIKKVVQNGYKIVWVTMRSLPLYEFTKKYIRQTVGVSGVLLTEPEQFLPAAKKQIFKKTGNVKANLIHEVRKLFSDKINPFIAGLGNRQNDAIAYHHAGIQIGSIFIVDSKSKVHKMDTSEYSFTYKQMIGQVDKFFPKYKGIKLNCLSF